MLYRKTELLNLLQISDDTWRRRKEDILEYLKTFWNYTIIPSGRSFNIEIKEEYAPLEPLPRKTKVKEIQEFYQKETENVIKTNPWNTGTNVARTILKYSNPYEHKVDTGSRYVRPILKEDYHLSTERKWCYLDIDRNLYIPISEEQEDCLKQIFKLYLSDDKTAEIMAAQDAGYITKDEVFNVLMGGYNDAMNKFIEIYGFRPIKIGEYMKNAF